MKRTLTIAALLLTFTLAAHADTIFITLDQPIQTAGPGDTTIYFTATISTDGSNTGDIYLNGDGQSLDSPMTLDDTGLFVNFPYPFTAGIAESYDDVIFTITLPGDEAAGSYFGTFFIYGGSDGGASDLIGSYNFEIDATGPSINPSPIPEPSSLILLGTGLTCMAGIKRKWRS